MEAKAKILLVEYDYNLGVTTQMLLEEHGYAVVHCADAETAWKHFLKVKFDICLMEVVLPRKSGLELLRQIRENDKNIPVFFLTSKGSDDDKIIGYKFGADVYLTKPFALQELLLRIDVWLKRNKPLSADRGLLYKIGDFHFNYSDCTLILGRGKNKEYITERCAQLFKFYLDNANRNVSREEILLNVWGKDDYFLGRSMDVFNTKIRKYLQGNKHMKLTNANRRGFTLHVLKMEMFLNGGLVMTIG